jgi:hypothetical protein
MVSQICLLKEVAGTSPLYFPIPQNKTVEITFMHIVKEHCYKNPSIKTFTQECYSNQYSLYTNKNSMALVHKWTILTKRTKLVHKVSTNFCEAEVEVTLQLTVSQSVSMSWYRVPMWDLRPDIISCRNVAVWNFQSCIYWAPSLTRGWVCNLQCNHSMVRVAQNPKPYFTVSSETPPAWRARFPYLYPKGTGWPSYTPGHWVPFTSSLTTRRATVEVF